MRVKARISRAGMLSGREVKVKKRVDGGEIGEEVKEERGMKAGESVVDWAEF
jgi:hypothetical protein